MPNISALSLVRNANSESKQQPTESELRERLRTQARKISAFSQDPRPPSGEELTFKAFEQALIPMVFALARTALALFLTCAERREQKRIPKRLERGERVFRPAPAQARNLETWFGVVRYFRTYMREVCQGPHRGFYPLDITLGLTADRVSMTLLAVAVRLATKLSFGESRSVLQWFLPTVPSTEVVEQAVLGFGRHTADWFESGAPAFEDDGDVLVIMIDSKGIPTATEEELKKRRRPRRKTGRAMSPRHRGRQHRKRRGRRRRRAKGDKSKNAKMGTVLVMYTLKRQGRYLLGPINRWLYASFACKKHAFAIARREANKRGFGPESGKVVQLVTDGDPDLGCYGRQYFSEAIHTVDIMHVFEKLWSAGECIHREGSEELQKWFDRQRDLLYEGKTRTVLRELQRHLDATAKKGPGNKGKRQRLQGAIRYIERRIEQMRYDELIAQDLEVSSGPVEGAVKYIVGRRCDHGGMRGIKERSEAILQLRCIELNGNWDDFIDYVHDRTQRSAQKTGERIRIQQKQPVPLPDFLDNPAEITEVAA